MQVKIFLASSEELEEDRRAFEILLARLSQDQHWRTRDIGFDLVVWENFIDAMSQAGLQEEYNKAVAKCDIFVMLFFTKVGPYTLQEFERAFKEMGDDGRPRIYTYFRNDAILTGDLDESVKSLLDFKARMKELKHYVTTYRNIEDLQFQFSRQLEKLYGDDQAAAVKIDERMPSFRVGEIALTLAYRHLFGSVAVDTERMIAAVELAPRQVRNTVFQMASEFRQETWLADKRLMERSIPLLEALTRADANWHRPWGQLGYALSDKVAPEWKRAKECLDRAVELRGDEVTEGLYYQYCRARCAVQLDAAFAQRKAAEPGERTAVLDLIKRARRDLGAQWDVVFKAPDSETIRAWLSINGSPKLA
ncbi:MAG TPA: hypothetical protein VLW55_24355 [Burkholderiaceae bacterium]|nr:hypothetical protein [Burkholderiaceae bacterium]